MNAANVEISTDPLRMDVAMIQSFLSHTYWAEGRSAEEVRVSIENSLPFGLFVNGKQVAFARVLSDRVVFAYLMDVFVLPEFQGQGLGRQLVDCVLSDERLRDVSTWTLKTRDAHGFYRQFGFETIADAERLMSVSR